MNDLSTTMEASAGAANLAWFLPRSPARQALSTHHAAVEAAVRGVAAPREPVARAQGIVAEADAALREAETAVGAIDAAQVPSRPRAPLAQVSPRTRSLPIEPRRRRAAPTGRALPRRAAPAAFALCLPAAGAPRGRP